MSTQGIRLGVILAVAATGVVVTVLAASLLGAYQRIPNAGNVKAVGVGVYWDSECTRNVTSIDWGFLEPGGTADVPVYVKNDGNVAAVLSMTKDNWDPAVASGYMSLSWNRESYVLNPGSVQAVLTLSVSSEITGVTNFSFDIIITGTESA